MTLKSDSSDQQVVIGDARKLSDFIKDSAQLIVTSPPYWDLKKYGDNEQIGQESYCEYIDSLNKVWDECFDCSKDNAVLVININSRRVDKKLYPIAFDIVSRMRRWQFWDQVIWNIPNALPQPNHYKDRILDNKFEHCLVFIKNCGYKFNKPRVPQQYKNDPRAGKNNAKGRCLGNIIRIPAYRPPNIKEQNYHIAAFPELLPAFFIHCYTDIGDTVLDPFAGSGTTLKVCRAMQRRGIGCEINPDYKPLIERRINEEWEVPDWSVIDLFHSINNV